MRYVFFDSGLNTHNSLAQKRINNCSSHGGNCRKTVWLLKFQTVKSIEWGMETDLENVIAWRVRGLCWIRYSVLQTQPSLFDFHIIFIFFYHIFILSLALILSPTHTNIHTQTHTHILTVWRVRHDLSFRPAAELNVVLGSWVPFKWVFLLCFSSSSTAGLFPHSHVVACEY